MSSCGAELLANTLQTSLIAGENFDLPTIDLNDPKFTLEDGDDGLEAATRLTNEDLTTGVIGGSGTFDALMKSVKAHLKEEYEKSRITGAEYTKAYIAITEAALSNSVQFLLGKDQAYWAAVLARYNAQVARAAVVKARVDLETSKVQLQLARIEANKSKAEYALTKMKIATESAAYCIAKFNLESILPANLEMLNEQIEAARGQTLTTRRDGTAISGTVGKQIQLYGQQIISYKRDAEVKAGKLFTDAWITQKTIDEGLLAPAGFTNANLDTILTVIKEKTFTAPEV
jgi:hypothetical protein